MDHFVESVITAFEKIHPLDRVPRAGYLLHGVAEPESVAAHSHFVAVMTLLFVETFPDRYDGRAALAIALIHDLPEAFTMDIPMPVVDRHLKDAKHAAEQTLLAELLDVFPGALAALHRAFVAAETPEARLVRGLDKAQMMIRVMMYQREGRGNLDEFWTNPRNFNDFGLPDVSELFDGICARAGKPRPR